MALLFHMVLFYCCSVREMRFDQLHKQFGRVPLIESTPLIITTFRKIKLSTSTGEELVVTQTFVSCEQFLNLILVILNACFQQFVALRLLVHGDLTLFSEERAQNDSFVAWYARHEICMLAGDRQLGCCYC